MTVDDNMFNRRREMEYLSNVLASTPQISVITGPVDSGKSRLVNRVILDLPKKTKQTIPIQLLDLRKFPLNSVESLAKHLDNDWMRITQTSVTIGDWEPSFEERQAVSNAVQIQHPIFTIDQAHGLKRLLRHKDGQAVLEELFDKFVCNTKEQHGIITTKHQNSHVVLISSDSFFDQWVEQFVGSSGYSVYVVGHLDKKEAEIYWKENILTENSHWLKNTDVPPEFDKVFEVCGGSMYLMDMFFREYCREPSNGPVHTDARNFHVVLQEERRIMEALTLVGDTSSEECPKWTKDKLRRLIKMLTASTGVLDYYEVCDTLGNEAVDSMIKYNIIHLRPTGRLSYDVNRINPIVTAVSPAALVAMKKVLAKQLIHISLFY